MTGHWHVCEPLRVAARGLAAADLPPVLTAPVLMLGALLAGAALAVLRRAPFLAGGPWAARAASWYWRYRHAEG